MASASPDRLAEDVRVLAVVVTELEFRDIERQIFGADLVERADNAPFEDRPEALNRVRVNRANYVLAFGVIDDTMRELFPKRSIAASRVGTKEAHFLGNRATHESGKSGGVNVLDNAGHHLTLALYRSDDWCFAGTDATSPSLSLPRSARMRACCSLLVTGTLTCLACNL